MISKTTASYFLGANSPNGFISQFTRAFSADDGWKAYIIKGGPGTGKSSLMKKCADTARKRGIEHECCYCSSDPKSLDAVIIPSKKIFIADGTAPHVIEPDFPAVCERIINLEKYIDSNKIDRSSSEIISLTRTCSEYHSQATRCLAAAGTFIGDTERISSKWMNTEKIAKFTDNFINREFEKSGEKANEEIRLLSAVTCNGVVSFDDTVKLLAKRVFVIKDDWYAVSGEFMQRIRDGLLKKNFSIVTAISPMYPYKRINQIIIKEADTAIVTENRFLQPDLERYRTFHSRRFLDIDKVLLESDRLRFNRKAADMFIDDAVSSMKSAKNIHDLLESHYINSIDFDGVNRETENLIKKIFE